MPQFPAVITLSSIDGSNGFRIAGTPPDNLLAVAGAGDVNGDGFADLIIGSYTAGNFDGVTYVVFGKASGFAANLDFSNLTGSNGFKILGGPGDYAGALVASAGDVNGDGFDDVIIGAPGHTANGHWYSGAAYVVFGKASGFAATLPASSLNGSNGFEIDGAGALDSAGWSVSSAGDVNGDGFADVILSAQPHTAPFNSAGVSYVVFGKASGFAANLNVADLNGSNGFTITGETAGDYSGSPVLSAGDINGDGFDDLIIDTLPNNSNPYGAAYVVFGKASGFGANLYLSSLNGSNGFKIGLYNVASAGDINGDGFADLVIGDIYGSGSGGYASGISYVVFGKASGFSAALDYSHLNGSNGFQISGEAPGDFSGFSVGSAGDVNGDGFDDLIIGAPNADPNGNASGSVYVVYGKASGFPANLSLSDLNGGNGFEIDGTGSLNVAGLSVSSAGDVNGDGAADMIIGVANGASYVVFGRSANASGTHTNGDFNADGKADILLQNVSGQPAVWLMNGTVFSSGGPVGSNPGTTWHTKVAGDFSGDGKADILWQNADGSVAIWFMNGTTLASGGVVSLNPGPSWQIVSAGDFNGDGKADILFQNADGTPAIWLMNGTTLSSGAALTNPGTSWHVIGSGDFNGDGKSDILWQNTDGTPAIWLMNGTSFVSGAALSNPGPSWHLKAAGDFNGDGKSDLLWQNTDGTAAIWLMNGTTFVSGGLAGSNPGSSWHAVGAGDFNGDGKADILWQNADGTPAVWLMNGTSVLSQGTLANPGSAWHVLAMGS